MPIKFNHVWKFYVGFSESAKWEDYADSFVVVHNGCYLKFLLFLDTNDGKGNPGVFVGLWSRNKDKYLKINYRATVIRSDGNFHRISDWYKDVIFDGDHHQVSPTPIAGGLAEIKSKGMMTNNDTNLCVAIELEIDQTSFNIEKALEEKIDGLCYKNFCFWAELYDKMMNGDKSTDYELVCQGNREKFPIHKIIARERSVYFKNRFESHQSFYQEKSLEVGWSPAVTEEVRYFLYNDKASEKFGAVPLKELAQVAGMLELDKLLAICEKSFLAKIPDDNEWDYLSIAIALKMKHLRNKVLCSLTENRNLMDELMDDEKEEHLRRKVGKFALKRGRAQLAVQ